MNGRRVTDMATLDAVRDAVGAIRVQIESQLTLSRRSGQSPLHVVSGNLVSTATPLGVIGGVDHQRAGRVRNIETDAIARIAAGRMISVLSPLGTSLTGELYNIRSDDLTAQTAKALARSTLGTSKVISFVLAVGTRRPHYSRPQKWPAKVSSEEAAAALTGANGALRASRTQKRKSANRSHTPRIGRSTGPTAGRAVPTGRRRPVNHRRSGRHSALRAATTWRNSCD